jgi:hypothetical protein
VGSCWVVEGFWIPANALLFNWQRGLPEPDGPPALKTEKAQPGVVVQREAQAPVLVTLEVDRSSVPATSCQG